MLQTGAVEEEKSIPKSRPKAKPRTKKGTGSTTNTKTNTKTIKSPGSLTERVAQACDRCRAKKTRCDGKLPACSSCVAVGFKCIVSDRLSRRAFPKGYTETLEERIRQLEAENKKLVGLLDLRDEQLKMLNSGMKGEDNDRHVEAKIHKVTSTNLSLLDNENKAHNSLHEHDDACPCGCSNPHAVHERPVSIAGSIYQGKNGNISIAGSINLSDDDDDNDSLLSTGDLSSIHSNNSNFQRNKQFASNFTNREISPAPGAFAAATAIAQMQKNKAFQQQQQQLENENSKQRMLTSLVAMSMPRSTEETLFIPTLLARICQIYGYNSKPAILTANAIASLKENTNEAMKSTLTPDRNNELLLKIIMNRNDILKLEESEASFFIKNLINLPTSRVDIDHLITIYFQDWGNIFPILDRNSFLKNYVKLTNILESDQIISYSESESSFESIEKFGAIMVLILSLSLLSNKHSHISSNNNETVNKYVCYLNHYDYLIHEFIKPNCVITKYCSIQSLQILSLALQYCLVIGDITTCYELRGRVITMAQQLRLHRCPAAVLGISGNHGGNVNLQNFMQGERRILFWCIYCLDIYSSLNLGVPRLLKDFEIECALPFSGKNDDDNDDNENILIINNTRLSIVGKVSRFALNVMLYCKVLGNILDSIFSRFENDDAQGKALNRDRMLDCWRRNLPNDLKFEIDVNGFSLRDNTNSVENNTWKDYNKQQLTLIFLYYHAKILIYLPIISKYGNHHNVGLSQKEKLTKNQGDVSTIVSSISMIQQSSIQILEVLKSLSEYSYLLPVPINTAREQARFALLVAKGSLDYIKGGPLYQNSKQLLLDTMSYLNAESGYDIPGGLTQNSFKLLELAVLSILGLNLNKNPNKKKMSPSNQPITKMAVSREPVQNIQLTRGKTSPSSRFNPTSGLEIIHDEMLHTLNQSQQAQVQATSLESDMTSTDNSDENEGLENILKFDPFKVNLNRELLINEFAADGSLGLVPFLDNDTNHVMFMYNNSSDNASIKVESDDYLVNDIDNRLFNWS